MKAPTTPSEAEQYEGTNEVVPENSNACLEGLRQDFNRGIVLIDKYEDIKSATTSWETVEERLLANDSALLKKAATMQGKGELIGVFKDEKLCIIDRGDKYGNREPVIIAFDAQNNRITITTDTPNRADVMKNIAENGKFANYWETREAVLEDGFTLPPEIVEAAEAVSGKPFIRSQNGSEFRSAILDYEDVSSSEGVRVMAFVPDIGRAIGATERYPQSRDASRGAVRALIG